MLNLEKNIQLFKDDMLSNGILPPATIVQSESDKFERFHIGHKKNLNGWYRFHGNAGAYGDWSKDVSRVWSISQKGLSYEEKRILANNIEKAKRDQIDEIKMKNSEASRQAESILDKCSDIGQSQYLDSKKVNPFGVKYGSDQYGDFVAVPLMDVDGKLWNVQKIYNKKDDLSSNKWFLRGGKKKGCFHVIGTSLKELSENDKIWIVEGYATGASIHMATNDTVIVAFDAGNIDPVINAIKITYPHLLGIVARDDDQWSKDGNNAGRQKAEDAAKKYGCHIVFPNFQEDHDASEPTDFNDLHCLEGLKEVTDQLRNFMENDVPLNNSINEKMIKLASLSKIEYEQQRKKVAKELGIRASVLDEAVNRLKPLSNNLSQKKPLTEEIFPIVEPWDTHVEAEDLLNEIINTLTKFAILPEHADVAIALWIVFTYFIDQVQVSPILAISSPEKQCGKTTVLSILTDLVAKPLAASNISSSCVFRSIELWKPTLIIDEADTFISTSEELRGVLNSGHTKPTAFVVRSVGDTHIPTRFTTWGAKAIALIGKLPDTLHDRSIVIPLKRKLLGEKTEKPRHSNGKIFVNLRSKILRFSQDNAAIIENARPILLDKISDRSADNWEPLLSIAELAGEKWLAKAEKAALALSNRTEEAKSKGVELLEDVKQIFEAQNILKISTKDLIIALCKDEEMPWATWNRGKEISPRQLSRIISHYNINSKTIRFVSGLSKGFEKQQFEEAWARYLTFTLNVTDEKVTPKNVTFLSVTEKHIENNILSPKKQNVTDVTDKMGIGEKIYNANIPSSQFFKTTDENIFGTKGEIE